MSTAQATPQIHDGFNIWKWQHQAGILYQDIRIQIVIAAFIGLNFLTNIVEKEIDPRRQNYRHLWEQLELSYNIIFTLEIMLNMYSGWFWDFWSSGWNVFDFTVVAIGLLDTARVDLPGPLKMLRMMRAFRVFRLFKKVKSLNKIVVSLVHAIPGMMNAFFINTLFMCIYAVLAVDLFGYAEKILETCEQENQAYDLARTGRSLCWSEEYFGTFGRSLYTLFQVLSGDSWSEAVVRPIFEFFDNPFDQFFSGMFFVTFILLNSVVLLNVVVAVLLDKMPSENDDNDEEEHDGKKQKGDQCNGPVDCKSANGTSLGCSLEKTPRSDVEVLKDEVRELAGDMRVRLEASRNRVDALTADVGRCIDMLEHIKKLRSTRLWM